MKLSIITINFNNLEGLKRTIDSVESQTFRDFEWIVIDGGSTDGSKELIEEHASSFTHWVSEPDEGIYNAMNKGIRQAHGEYLLFLNSGDWLFEDTTLEQVLQRGLNEDICFGQILLHYSDRPAKALGLTTSNFSIFGLLEQGIPHQGAFFSRKVFDLCGLYDESYRIAADQDLTWRAILQKGCTVQYLGLIVAHQEGDGISITGKELCAEELNRFKHEHFPRLFGEDHPEFYNPKEVRKAMRIYKRLQSNPIIKLYCKLFRS